MNPTTNIDRMRVSGGTSPTAINGDHVLGATVNSRPSYVLASGIDLIWSGTYWEIRSGSTARWRSSSPHGTLPSDVAVWTAQNASTGTIAVAAISRGPDSLVGSSSPGAPDAAAELIEPGGGATPDAAGALFADGPGRFQTTKILQVSGTLSPNAAGLIGFVEIDIDGYEVYSSNGEGTASGDYPWTRLYSNVEDSLWVLEHHPSGDSGTWRNWHATLTGMVLDADDWAPAIFNPPTGTPAFAAWPAAPGSIV